MNKVLAFTTATPSWVLTGRAGQRTRQAKWVGSKEWCLGMPVETPAIVVEEERLCLTRRRRSLCCSRCLARATSCCFLRGDPFSPVTHLQFVLGSIHQHFLLQAIIIIRIKLHYLSILLQYPGLNSPLVADSPASEFRHEFKVKRRNTRASPTSRPLLPPTLAIELVQKLNLFSPTGLKSIFSESYKQEMMAF